VRILFLTRSFNSLAQRLYLDLTALGQEVSVEFDISDAVTIEAVALGGALGNAGSEAREWIETLRHVQLQITGADLLAAGIPTGPEIGRRLGAVLGRKLDGELEDGPDAELRAALEERGWA